MLSFNFQGVTKPEAVVEDEVEDSIQLEANDYPIASDTLEDVSVIQNTAGDDNINYKIQDLDSSVEELSSTSSKKKIGKKK